MRLRRDTQHSDRARLRLAFGCRAALADIIALLTGELRIGAWVAIDEPVGEKVSEAEDCRDAKAPAPAECDDRDRHQRHANDVGEFRRRVEDRSCRGALAAREPVAGGLGIGREGRRFRDAEQNPRSEDEAEAAGESDNSRSDAPQECANTAHRHYAKPVEHDSDRDLQDGVGPEEGAEKQTQITRGQAELLLQLRRGDRDVHAVEIIDENARAEQKPNHPPTPADDRRLYHGGSSTLRPLEGRRFPSRGLSIRRAAQRLTPRAPARLGAASVGPLACGATPARRRRAARSLAG